MPEQERIAILYDRQARFSPSNKDAIELFCEAASAVGLHPSIIARDDIHTLDHYSGLFLRDTTHPGDYTMQFALAAENLSLPVLDSPNAISQGCNKFWQLEAFKQFSIPHPNSCIVAKESFLHVAGRINYPCVIKRHDSCFSQGVWLASNREDFLRECRALFKLPIRCLLIQDFIPSSFDWRLCFLDKKLLFACKYFLVDGHWKVVKYDRRGKFVEGRHEVVDYAIDLPEKVLLAYGLWGIDIKQMDNGNVFVIETNDNPSIDHGVEDQGSGLRIYSAIMEWFREKIHERQKRGIPRA